MRNFIKASVFFLTLATLLVSCSHQPNKERTVASHADSSCWDSVKGEYQTYFDSVEKCIEKQSDK